jgi:hypothetical protein
MGPALQFPQKARLLTERSWSIHVDDLLSGANSKPAFEEAMDETYKTALRASLHRWVDEALDSIHGDVDLSRQALPSHEVVWQLQLRWTGGPDDHSRLSESVKNESPHAR